LPGTAPATSKAAAAAQKIKLHHYTVLLISELLFILVYPFFIGTSARDGVMRGLAVVVFSAALYAVMGRGRITIIAFVLGVPAILIHAINVAGYLESLQTLSLILGLVFLMFMTSVFIWSIVSDPSVTTDTLAGAVSAYMLMGITFGIAYSLIDRLVPGAFRDTLEPGKHLTQSEFTFFSFVTMTTVGYGDIVPRDAHARSVAMIEAVIGIMYPAVLISRLVGLHGSRHGNE
jgi:Ion channel